MAKTPVEQAGVIIGKMLQTDEHLSSLVTGVYRDEAPENAKFPYTIFSLNENGNENSLDGTTGMVEAELFVRTVGTGVSRGLVDGATDRINQMLGKLTYDDPTSKMGMCSQLTRPYSTWFSGGGYDGVPGIGGYYRLQLMPDDGGTPNA